MIPGRCLFSAVRVAQADARRRRPRISRSEEHTSELQSPCNLVCRLLLEKKMALVAVDQQHVLHGLLLRSLTRVRRTETARIDTCSRPTAGRLLRPAALTRGQHAIEQRERAGLVERLVQVAALRALHAGRAASLAR